MSKMDGNSMKWYKDGFKMAEETRINYDQVF